MPNLANLKIGDFVLDPSRDVLIGGEGEIALEPKVVEVLLALAARPNLVLSRDELIDAVWKAEFGADERLTRAISLLRKAFGDERGAARYIETVPKRGYRLVASVEPAPRTESAPSDHSVPAPEVHVARNGASAAASPSPPSRRWQGYAFAAGVGLALGAAGIAWIFWRDLDSADAAHARDVVELLPFVLIEGKPGLDAFARQVHASVKRVMASNQVSLIDGTAKQAEGTSSEELKESEFILTGSLERVDDRYAVTLYFDNRDDGQTLWSQRFTRPVDKAEALREEIGANATYVIGCALNERARARTKPSLAAFKAYLETCDPQLTWGTNTKKLAAAQRLTDAAPDDAYGHGLAALFNMWLSHEYGLNKAQSESYRAAARKAAARALELDPTSALAPLVKAFEPPVTEGWREQETLLISASIRHPAVRGTRGGHLRAAGRLKEAMHVTEQFVAVTPLSAVLRVGQAVMHMQQGDHETADRLFEEVLQIWPDFEVAHWFHFVNEAFYGDPDQALKLLNDPAMKHFLKGDDMVCWRSFIEARAAGTFDSGNLRKACASERPPDYLARKLAALGDTDGAYDVMRNSPFDWLGSTVFLFYPEMARFRSDARFMAFIANSGLLEFWTESGHWPDFCDDKTLPYDCKTAAARALVDKRRSASTGKP